MTQLQPRPSQTACVVLQTSFGPFQTRSVLLNHQMLKLMSFSNSVKTHSIKSERLCLHELQIESLNYFGQGVHLIKL